VADTGEASGAARADSGAAEPSLDPRPPLSQPRSARADSAVQVKPSNTDFLTLVVSITFLLLTRDKRRWTTGRLSTERKEEVRKAAEESFLWPTH
jgi:hypothetical protein